MSTDYRLYLFVGGPVDGRRVPLPGSEPPERFYYPIRQSCDSEEYNSVEYAVYRRERFQGGSKTVIMYVEQALTIEDVVTMIFDKYPQQANVN